MPPKAERAQEIFGELCQKNTIESLTKKFPTVREIRSAFGCSQKSATDALNLLAKHFHFRRGNRKIRPMLDLSTQDAVNAFLYRKQTCTVALMQGIAYYWLPVIEEFNRTHEEKLCSRVLNHCQEYDLMIADNTADIVILQNHPVVLGLKKGLRNFVDLGALSAKLQRDLYHPASFVYDSQGCLRGIAPALIPKLLCCKQGIIHEYPLAVDRISAILRKLHSENPGLIYPAVIDCYLDWFSYWGLLPDIPNPELFPNRKLWHKAYSVLKKSVTQKLLPVISDLSEYGFPLFYENKTAMLELYSVQAPRWNQGNIYEYHPQPVIKNVPYNISSEVMAINQSSGQYELAWQFIEFVLSAPIQQKLLKEITAFSVIRDLKPAAMPDDFYRNLYPAIEHAVRRPAEKWLNPRLFQCFESGIDRLLKYGGDIDSFFDDFTEEYLAIKEELL